MSFISPTTHDYVITNGSATPDPLDGIANAVYIRLETPLGSYWADKTLGSKLHLLKREKDVPRVKQQAVQYAEQALSPLLTAKRIQGLEITTEQPQKRQLLLLIEVTLLNGKKANFQHTVKVGG